MKKRILVTPLNWGLGHVTRSIPLINALQELGCSVYLASDGVASYLLKAEFPNLPVFNLPSYGVRYESKNMLRNIIPRLPGLISAINKEQEQTQKLVKEHNIDGILSDNRYGCYVHGCPNTLISHQLNLRYPNKLLQATANWLLKKSLQNFDQIWVPDTEKHPNLSGELSHNAKGLHKNIEYIGILSRMRNYEVEKEYDIAVVLSGPEPQRTLLEEKLMEQALGLPFRFIFVQGKTQSHSQYFASEHVEVTSYLTSEELNKVILASDVVVCRSGYSSLMDLARTGKKALLIPTPGQTEQEYLAEQCTNEGIFPHQNQYELNLEKGIQQANVHSGFNIEEFPRDSFLPFLEKWVLSL